MCLNIVESEKKVSSHDANSRILCKGSENQIAGYCFPLDPIVPESILPNMKRSYAQLLLSCINTLFFVSVTSARTVVYVSESKDNRIGVFSLDESNGDLSRMGQIALVGAPGSLTTNSDNSLLYASVRTAGQFATLKIDQDTGLLSHIKTAPASGGSSYVYLDKTEQWLLSAYYREGLVSVSRVKDGIVTGEPVCVLDVGLKAHCIQVDPANQFAFSPHPVDLNRIDQFHFDNETGQLSLNDPPAVLAGEGQGPRHLQFHPNGRWVYVVNEQGKGVTQYDYDSKAGTLSIGETWSTHPVDWDMSKGSCADIEISADGRFVYASNRGHYSIAVFSVDQTSGGLTTMGQTKTETTPRSFNLIPGDERFLVAAWQGSSKLVVYRRNIETGILTQLKTYDSGASPAWVLGVKLENP